MGRSRCARTGLGSARWTATCRRPAARTSAASTCVDGSRFVGGSRPWRPRADVGLARPWARAFGCARPDSPRPDSPRRAHMGSRTDGAATAPGAGSIVGRPGCGRTRGTAGPNLGLARPWARALGAASAAIVGCAQARRPAAGGCALVGK